MDRIKDFIRNNITRYYVLCTLALVLLYLCAMPLARPILALLTWIELTPNQSSALGLWLMIAGLASVILWRRAAFLWLAVAGYFIDFATVSRPETPEFSIALSLAIDALIMTVIMSFAFILLQRRRALG